jgi:ankyrin repeat protein
VRIVNASGKELRNIVPMLRTAILLFALLLDACEPRAPEAPDADVLHDLAAGGRTRPLLQAIEEGQAVDRRDICYRTPLMFAAQAGHLETVRALLARGARVDLHEKGYYTALMLAAGNGHTEVVRALAAAGAAVDEIERTRGWTALIWAAQRGHRGTVRLLLELGADLAIRDRQGRSARDWAGLQGHPEIVALL